MQLKEDLHFSSLAAIDYTHGHNPNPHPPQLSQMPLITGSPQVVGLCRYTHTVSCASRHPVLMKHSARTEKEMLSNLFQDEREERLKTWEVLNDYSRFNFSPENSNSSTHGILSSFTGCYNALPT